MSNQMAISKFKSHCLEVLDKLEKSKSSIIITKRNKPIATISPFVRKKESLFGLLANKAEIKGDIIAPIDDSWEVTK